MRGLGYTVASRRITTSDLKKEKNNLLASKQAHVDVVRNKKEERMLFVT